MIQTMLADQGLACALGAVESLSKPVQREELTAILSRYNQPRSGCTALIVEDDPLTRELLRRSLDGEGWQICEPAVGLADLHQLSQNHPQIILLDLQMPELDGFGLVEELQRHEQWRTIPIVVITARDLTAEDRGRLNGYVARIL
ncbi:MAG: response regulator [Dehalococcoidia bacterium]